MNAYAEKLEDYLAENPLHNGQGNKAALIEELYWYYAENNPSVNETVRQLNKQANSFFSHLTLQETDELFSIFNLLCVEQELWAFRGGIRLGTQLMLELLEQP